MDAQNQNQPHQQAASPPPATVSDISSYQAPAPAHQQPQQQYQQPMYHPQQPTYLQPPIQPVAMRSPRAALYSKNFFNTKIVLRSFDLVFCITLIGLAVANLFIRYSYDGLIIFAFCLPVGALGFLWETAEFITICARGGKLGIHPGAHVGMHLVTWMFAAVALGIASALTSYDYEYNYRYSDSSSWYYRRDPSATYATLAITGIVLALQFALFIIACVETHKVNRQASAVYLVQPDGQVVPINVAMGPMVQQPMRQSTYSMSPAGVPPAGVEPKGQAGEPGYRGSVAQQPGEGLASPDGTYYGQGNGFSQQQR